MVKKVFRRKRLSSWVKFGIYSEGRECVPSRFSKTRRKWMGEILNQGRGDSIKPVIMGLCSDTKPKSSLPVHEVKKADFGPENGEKQKQDKEVAHSASLPLPRCSDSGKPTWRDSRRKAYSHDERKDLRTLAYSFGGDLLERMSSDQEMMERIHAKEEARKILLKAMGFVPGRPIPHANVKTVFDGESNVDDEDKEFIEGGFVYMKEKPKEAKAYDA